MAGQDSEWLQGTYPLRVAARLTGLSPACVRAWETRYGAVEPLRTAGGTRRYTVEHLERLRALKAGVDAGHRIGGLAKLDASALSTILVQEEALPPLGSVLQAAQALDAVRLQRLLSVQLASLGTSAFIREVACPLVQQVGDRWRAGHLSIAAEHLITAELRSLMGASLRSTGVSEQGPSIVFVSPEGERHELGLLMAALTALDAGANPIYLGVELPIEEMVSAAVSHRAAALGVGLVVSPADRANTLAETLRAKVPSGTLLWFGGRAAMSLCEGPGLAVFRELGELKRRVEILRAATDVRIFPVGR